MKFYGQTLYKHKTYIFEIDPKSYHIFKQDLQTLNSAMPISNFDIAIPHLEQRMPQESMSVRLTYFSVNSTWRLTCATTEYYYDEFRSSPTVKFVKTSKYAKAITTKKQLFKAFLSHHKSYNAFKRNCRDFNSLSINHRVINKAFNWADSLQGDRYWYNLHNKWNALYNLYNSKVT